MWANICSSLNKTLTPSSNDANHDSTDNKLTQISDELPGQPRVPLLEGRRAQQKSFTQKGFAKERL